MAFTSIDYYNPIVSTSELSERAAWKLPPQASHSLSYPMNPTLSWLSVLFILSTCLAHATENSAIAPPTIHMAPPSAGLPALPAVVRNESTEQSEARLKWFREARFGIFIHWGVYAVPAGFWQGKPVGAEWIMN